MTRRQTTAAAVSLLTLALQGTGCSGGSEGLSSTHLKTAAVHHKAFIAVAEKGTEAAAAPAVVFVATSAAPDPLSVTLDRPFLFFVRDESTGAICFMGRVSDPSAKT